MGSSETGGAVTDCSVGSIVWVRRRNGSWWPGKILGPEEISSAHITSPRSGTPVKLLGREDASVDWYNLEKSKRVKDFRCGEFDECIERAEASQGMPPKKREKYARREDAILHALELERQLLEKKYGKLGYSSCHDAAAVTSSEYLENGQTDEVSEKRLGSSPPLEKKKNVAENEESLRERNNQLSGDDESAPRMRGLQDFGLRTAPIRDELPGPSFRAQRSRYAYLLNDSEDYEIPVSKFEESDGPYSAEDHISGSTEDTETDCSDTESTESDTDDDEFTELSDGSASIELRPKYPRRIESHEEYGSISSDDLDELTTFAVDSSHPFPNELLVSSSTASKWQLKRKRNIRNLGKKRSLDRTDSEVSMGYNNKKKNGRHSNWNHASGFEAEKSFTTPLATRYVSPNHNIVDLDGLMTWNHHQSASIRGFHWEEDIQEFIGDPLFFGKKMMLLDVDLQVEASNYRRDVPMISLMSKFNGHAIIGHPLAIEAMENGSSDIHLASTAQYFFPPGGDSPNAIPPPVWRTGRRTTNFRRVPRQHLSLDSDGFVEDPYKKLPFGGGHKAANVTRRNFKSSRRNSPKKSSPSSNQKIRTLSSIASQHKQHPTTTDRRISENEGGGDGMMSAAATTVACIPVTLVFSRLQEELIGRTQPSSSKK